MGGAGQGDGTGGEGQGRGGDPGEYGASGNFKETQFTAIGLNRGTVIARRIKKGLPDDLGDRDLPHSGTLAEFVGEMEEAMEHQEIPREHRERVKAYSESLLKSQNE